MGMTADPPRRAITVRPLPGQPDRDAFLADIAAIQARVPKGTFLTMAEIDAEFYDADGLPRCRHSADRPL
jgi:hypothetical protein